MNVPRFNRSPTIKKQIRAIKSINSAAFSTDILCEKSKRSKLESIYRRCKTKQNKINFKNQSKLVAKLVTASKRSLYRSQINQHSNNPKKLWPIMNSLLSCTLPQSLPTFSCASNLATSFLNFFTDKIAKLSASFPSVPLISPHCPPPVPPPNHFQF